LGACLYGLCRLPDELGGFGVAFEGFVVGEAGGYAFDFFEDALLGGDGFFDASAFAAGLFEQPLQFGDVRRMLLTWVRNSTKPSPT
jgi:hypothetical protein